MPPKKAKGKKKKKGGKKKEGRLRHDISLRSCENWSSCIVVEGGDDELSVLELYKRTSQEVDSLKARLGT